MKVRMINDQILIKKMLEDYTKTAGGIIIQNPDVPKTCKAEVISVGPGKPSLNGELISTTVKEGDIIQINSKIGTEVINEDGTKLYVITEPQIYFVYENEGEKCKCNDCKGDCKGV